jgi:hypothetical protein
MSELWHTASNGTGLIMLAKLASDIYGVHDSPKPDKGFAVLAKCLQSTGADLGAAAHIQERNIGQSLRYIFHYAVSDPTPWKLQGLKRSCACKTEQGRVSRVQQNIMDMITGKQSIRVMMYTPILSGSITGR